MKNKRHEKVPYIVKSWSFKNIHAKPKPLLKLKKNYIYVPQRPIVKVGRALKFAFFVGISAILIYSYVKASFYNNTPPVKDPFQAGEVWDNNGNDIEFDENGDIVFDKLTEEERVTLYNTLNTLIYSDAQSYIDDKIGNIDKIMSISMIPYDLSEKDNPLYFISILFKDQKDSYALNYLASKDFQCNGELTSEYVAAFSNYLMYECSIDSCQKMNKDEKKLLAICPNATHVGEVYLGKTESGEDRYFIPIYYNDGSVKVYSAWTAHIDGNDFDPIERLYKELLSPQEENYFECSSCSCNTSTAKMVEIFNGLSSGSQEEKKEDIDISNYAKLY